MELNFSSTDGQQRRGDNPKSDNRHRRTDRGTRQHRPNHRAAVRNDVVDCHDVAAAAGFRETDCKLNDIDDDSECDPGGQGLSSAAHPGLHVLQQRRDHLDVRGSDSRRRRGLDNSDHWSADPSADLSHKPFNHRKREPVPAAGLGVGDEQQRQDEAERTGQSQHAEDPPADAAGEAHQLPWAAAPASVRSGQQRPSRPAPAASYELAKAQHPEEERGRARTRPARLVLLATIMAKIPQVCLMFLHVKSNHFSL